MNIKRAFFAAAAVIMLPGAALAQSTEYFEVTTVAGPDDQSYTASITCNAGSNLEDSLELNDGNNWTVTFTNPEMVIDNDTVCIIELSSPTGGYFIGSVNGYDGLTSCTFVGNPADVDESNGFFPFAVDHINACDFALDVEEIEFEIIKEWDLDDNALADDVLADIEVICYNVMGDQGLTTYTYSYSHEPGDTASMMIYPGKPYTGDGPGTYCRVYETNYNSAVESDDGCDGDWDFDAANTTATCTITNTVFYEGIPTLSQYGMAIMALLMLGVGFVGFRRFV